MVVRGWGAADVYVGASMLCLVVWWIFMPVSMVEFLLACGCAIAERQRLMHTNKQYGDDGMEPSRMEADGDQLMDLSMAWSVSQTEARKVGGMVFALSSKCAMEMAHAL
jgi:hypothetical protein